MKVEARVPGKLMLAGEYAVFGGGPAIACAVRRYLECAAEPAQRWTIAGNGKRWEEGGPDVPELHFAREALSVAVEYLSGRGPAPAPVAIAIDDDLRAPGGEKLGLGGSACTCAGVVAAVLASAGRPVEQELVFKLAALAHGLAQSRPGSAVDVAAACFGGTIFTRRFDLAPLTAARRTGTAGFAAAVERTECPAREQLREPPGLLLVFSGQSASTAALVEQVEGFAGRERKLFAEFMARTSASCDRLRRALEARDGPGMFEAVKTAGGLLEVLGEQSGVPIVTPAHRAIIGEAEALGIAAKVSGSGGGDSCIALGSPEALDELASALEAKGFLAQGLAIDAQGVRLE